MRKREGSKVEFEDALSRIAMENARQCAGGVHVHREDPSRGAMRICGVFSFERTS